jgi:hypothetical protein
MTDQLDLPFAYDDRKLGEYLTRACALDDEQDRLREELRLLKESYADDFPMRALSTALKVVRARRKLAVSPKGSLTLAHQAVLEGVVMRHLDALDAERVVPDMTGITFSSAHGSVTLGTSEDIPHA